MSPALLPVLRRPRRLLAATLLLALLPLTACVEGQGGGPGGGTGTGTGAAERAAAGGRAHPSGVPAPEGAAPAASPEGAASPKGVPGPPAASAQIPGLGPATRAAIPPDTRQAVVVQGHGRDLNTGTATLYERRPTTGWTAASDPWPAHNAVKGWTDHHVRDDLRSPIGVFRLTDAGGLLPDPGAKLPYDQSPRFVAIGTGSLGEPLEGSFDYVVAINYNRVPGRTPLDRARPLGEERGGGIWLHVDHDGPTQGCVSLLRAHMRELLRRLDPAHKPVVVMGDVHSLAR
ncbi:L,D-transpeptidase family protein [Streptomyces thermolilacinus]